MKLVVLWLKGLFFAYSNLILEMGEVQEITFTLTKLEK